MAKKVEIEVDIKGNVVESSKNLRALKQQLKDLPAGTSEWSKVKNDIRDIEDALESAGQSSEDFKGMLENAPGPLGMLGGAIKKVELATKSFGAAFKAIGIGLLVSLIGGLVAAFSQTEGSMKKLEPLMIGLEKILGGLVEVMMPVVDMFMDLAMKALPYVTKGIGMVYSAFAGLFTYIKTAGMAAGKIIKGIFTLDFDTIKEGIKDAMAVPGKVVDSYNESMARFEKGTEKVTKTQKKNAEDLKAIADKALADRLKNMEANDKLDEAKLQKLKEEELAKATTEQQKLDIEKAFAKKAYDMKIKDYNDKMALYKKDSDEYKNLLAERTKLEGERIKEESGFKTQQVELNKKSNKELLDDEINTLNLKKAKGELTEEQYQKSLYETKKKYTTDKKELADIEIAYETYKTQQKKKLAEDERSIALMALQDQMNDLDKKNALLDFDFQEDLNRLAEKRLKVDEAEKLELANTELNEVERNKIIQKYADQRKAIGESEVATTKALEESKYQIKLAAISAIGSLGSLLQQMANENKDLAITGLIIEKAAALASIAVNAKKNFIKDGGIKSPLAWLNLAAAGIAAGAVVYAAVKGVNDIKNAGKNAGGGSTDAGKAPAPAAQPNLGQNYGDGGMINGPLHAQGGVMINAEGGEAVMTRGAVTAFGPLLSAMNQMGGGRSFGAGQNQGAAYDQPQTVAPLSSPMVVKTYVVSNELTSEQEKQAKLKSLSTL
jgi:hypothetical protein